MVALSVDIEGIVYFATIGAGIAMLKHGLSPFNTLLDLTPVAINKSNGSISPEAEWWGGYAFAAMNAGTFVQGMYAIGMNSTEGKLGTLLSVGVIFCTFSMFWFTKGAITKKPDYQVQGLKVGMFGLLFVGAFVKGKWYA